MKNFIKSILFVGILILLIECCNLLFIPKHTFFKSSNYEISGEKEDSIDVIFIGDSLVYSSLSPMEIWNEYGITSYDCADAAQIIPDTYDHLKYAIESQHPNVVFMEANVLFRDPKKRKFNVTAAQTALSLFPIAKYHDNWKKYLQEKSDGLWINQYKGYKYITKIKSNKLDDNYMEVTEEYNKIPDHNLEYFEKIIKLCEDNNTKLILISFPSQISWKYKKHNSATLVAETYGLDFIDLNLVDLGIEWKTDTKDNGAHLNHTGSVKVSKYVGQYIKNHNLAEDHRGDKEYDSWNIAYKMYKDTALDQADAYTE